MRTWSWRRYRNLAQRSRRVRSRLPAGVHLLADARRARLVLLGLVFFLCAAGSERRFRRCAMMRRPPRRSAPMWCDPNAFSSSLQPWVAASPARSTWPTRSSSRPRRCSACSGPPTCSSWCWSADSARSKARSSARSSSISSRRSSATAAPGTSWDSVLSPSRSRCFSLTGSGAQSIVACSCGCSRSATHYERSTRRHSAGADPAATSVSPGNWRMGS